MRLTRFFVTLLAGIFVAKTSMAADQITDNTLYLDLKDGRVVIEMLPNLAPKHVARIKELVRAKFYDGLVWHRVMEGFMAQTGDPTGTGMSGSGQKIAAEFTSTPFERGIVGMARANDPNSGDSQFFIMFASSPSLNGSYTVWGKVTSGMEFVDKIKKASAGSAGGQVTDPDKIISMRMAADDNKVPEAKTPEAK